MGTIDQDTWPTCEVWILHRERVVLLQESMGVPAAAVIASDGTIGGTYFDPDTYLGPWPLPCIGWGDAWDVAQAKAAELGYRVEVW